MKIPRNKKGQFIFGHHQRHSLMTKKKISIANKGRKFSEIHKKNLSISHKGHKVREDVKEKIKNSISKEKHPNWKGGITPIVYQVRNSFKYRQWRSDIFTRDNYTCVNCNLRGVYLEADHYPKRFSVIFREYKIKTFNEAMDCDELWNINNGRTLCKKCHNKTKGWRTVNE